MCSWGCCCRIDLRTQGALFPILCDESGRGTKNLIYDNCDVTVNKTDGMDLELPELQLRPLKLRAEPPTNSHCTPNSPNFPALTRCSF